MKTKANLAPAAILSLAFGACACGSQGDTQTVPSEVAVAGLPTGDPLPAPEALVRSERLATIRPEGGNYGKYPATVESLGQTLRLNGAGLCEWGMFGIDLYRAALFSEQPTSDAEALMSSRQVLAIHLQFVRSLTRAQLTQAYTASVQANVSEEDFESTYRAPLDEFVATLVDVDEGNSLTFTSNPGSGLHVQFDGESRGLIEDDAFRALFVRLYLGAKPPSEELRENLLNGGV